MTEKRSRSLTRSLSDKFVEPLTNVRPLSLSFLSDHDKKKGRERDRSRESKQPSQPTRDKSKDKGREIKFRDFTRRENSVEKTKFTYHDNKSNSYNGYPIKDPSLETKKKNYDHRKISKQNTYVLQNGKSSKQVVEKKSESESSILSTTSVEDMDYSRVIDDISPIPEKEEESETHYAEICDYEWRNGGIHRNDAPLSLPNINLTRCEEKFKKEERKVMKKISNGIRNFSDIGLRSNNSLKKSPLRKSPSSPNDSSSSYRSSPKASDGSLDKKDSLVNGNKNNIKEKLSTIYMAEMDLKDSIQSTYTFDNDRSLRGSR